jgi:O-antigen/teichoic acid export membrane protein
MVYLATGGFWLGIGSTVASLSALAVTIVFANLLPPEIFGTYKFVLSVGAMLSALTLGGLNTALIRAIAQNHSGTVNTMIRLKLQWGFVAFLVGLGVATYYVLNDNAQLATAFLIAAALIPLVELGGLYGPILAGGKEFKKNTYYDIALNGSITVILCTVAFITHNLFILLTAYFGLWTLGRLYALYRVTRPYTNAAGSVSGESVLLGKHLSIMGVVNTIASNIDRVLLFHLLGPVSVAAYSVAISPVERLTGFSQLIKPLGIPKLSNQVIPMTARGYWRKFVSVEAVLALGTLVYILAAPIIFGIIFPQYEHAVLYTQILSLGILSAALPFNSSILIALNARRELYIQSFGANLFKIILTVVGGYLFGLWGIIGAFVIARLAYLALSTVQTIFLLNNRQAAYEATTP